MKEISGRRAFDPSRKVRRSAIVLIFFTCALLLGFDEGFHVEFRCREVRQGEPVLVVLSPENPVESAEGEWLGQKFSFSPEGERFVGLVAIDRGCSPGTYELNISVRIAGGGETRLSRQLQVSSTSFQRQELSVDPRFVHLSKEDLERVQSESALLRKVYAASSKTRQWSGPYAVPAEAEWSAPFGVSRVFNGEERSYHRGADVAVPAGTEVQASNSGLVVLARDLFFGGNTVIVDHGLGVFTGYMHLSKIIVSEGREVRTGELLGLSGATGRVTGPHLHWMLRINGIVCDPRGLLEIDFD